MAALWAQALLEVQKIDLKLRDCETRLSMLPKERRRIADRKKAADAKIEAVRAEIRELELAIKKSESEMAAVEQHIDKLQKQSALVKKNAEYQTMMAEIEISRKRLGDLENAILARMDQLESLKEKLAAVTAKVNTEVRALKTEWMEFDEVEKAVKAKQSELALARTAAAGRIEATMMARYDELLKSPGIPLATIENDICNNCSLKLTPQTLTNARRGSLALCDNCGHLVYIEDL
ncbi:MAG: zinc ribbon domain-containing protein [Victivallaceae bacterium]